MKLPNLNRDILICLLLALAATGCKASTALPSPTQPVPSAVSVTPTSPDEIETRPAALTVTPSIIPVTPIPTATAVPSLAPSSSPTVAPTVYPPPYDQPPAGYPAPGTEIPQQPYIPPEMPGSTPYPGISTPWIPPTSAPYPQPGTITPAPSLAPMPTAIPPTIPAAVSPTTPATSTPFILRTQLHATDPTTVNLAAGKPQLIEFFAYWSITCRSMAPVVHLLEARYAGRIGFVYLDIDDPQNNKFMEDLDYRIQPHYYLIDGQGNIIQQWVGYVNLSDFESSFNALVGP